MPKKSKTKLPKGKGFWNIRQPEAQSARNVKIWRAVIVDGRTQTDVAGEHKLSQARVSQIVRDVKRYIAASRPFGGEDWHPDEQISYTNQLNKLRLEKQYEQSLVGYGVSKLPTETLKIRTYVDVNDKKEEIPRRKVNDYARKIVPQGDVRFLQQQLRLCDQMRKIDLSQATLPKAYVSLYPDIDAKHLTLQERKDLVQKLYVRWYDMQQQLESQQTGKPAKQWPIEEYIDIDGQSVQKQFEEREQAFKDRELDLSSREFDLQCLEKRLKQRQEQLDQHSAWLRSREDNLATRSNPTHSSPSLRDGSGDKVAADRATESRGTLNSEKRPSKDAYVQNNYPPESVSSVYFPTRADELAYLNKGLYSESEIRRDGGTERQSEGGTERGRAKHPSVSASPPKYISQRSRDLQFKYTFYDKDGNVTDVCPWGG